MYLCILCGLPRVLPTRSLYVNAVARLTWNSATPAEKQPNKKAISLKTNIKFNYMYVCHTCYMQRISYWREHRTLHSVWALWCRQFQQRQGPTIHLLCEHDRRSDVGIIIIMRTTCWIIIKTKTQEQPCPSQCRWKSNKYYDFATFCILAVFGKFISVL